MTNFSSKYSTNNDQLSELEVDISNEKDLSPNQTKSKFDALQQQGSTSPYFIAQSIALPESRAIQTTSCQKAEKRQNKTSPPSNISSSISNTTSFSDVSLYDQNISCNQNVSEEKNIPSSFQSKGLSNQIQCENISTISTYKTVLPTNTMKEKCISK